MQLTFLQAAVPLSKTLTYSARDDAFTMSHYPLVRRVSSFEREVDDMRQFKDVLSEHAHKGHCLLLGGLSKVLRDESRAEHAKKDWDHHWVCFDMDKVDATPDMDGALDAIERYLPEACQRAAAVIQLSPSCFNPRANKLSCHVFMRLNEPISRSQLQDFLIWCNFNNDALRSQISLNDSGNTLSFRVDRCVVDASRLIYVAPPRMVGFKNEKFENESDWLDYFNGDAGFTLPTFTPIDRAHINEKINELRDAQGLPVREFRTIKLRGYDVLSDAEEGVISDVRASGNQYIRFNLNGGDSLAYFIDLKNPELIGNFKGEPYMMTKEVDPQFYKTLIKTTRSMPMNASTPESLEVLAFYATNHRSTLYIGTYDRATDKLRVDPSSETAAAAWLQKFGVPGKNYLPHYDLVHDISNDVRYEEGYPLINLYERTNFMKQFAAAAKVRDLRETMQQLDQHCPVIMKFLRSITGDPRSAMGFVNWLSFIFQNRIKAETAWVLWGTEGSGKGKFLEHVCKPLLGQSSVAQVMMSNVDKQFNQMLEGKLLVNIDEAAMPRSRDKIEAMSKLRNWITEPFMVIDEKNVNERSVPSFCNFIISSNDFRPIVINGADRRFHVGTRQENRLLPTPNEFATLVQGEELPHFARLLGELKVDEHWVRNPELTEQKMRLFESSHSTLDMVAVAIHQGDTAFFLEARPSNVQLNATPGASLAPIAQYDDLLRAMLNNTFNVITQEDLYVLFSIVIGDTRLFPENMTGQRNIYNRYGLLGKQTILCKRTNVKRYGAEGPEWQQPPDMLLEEVARYVPNTTADPKTVVPMRKNK